MVDIVNALDSHRKLGSPEVFLNQHFSQVLLLLGMSNDFWKLIKLMFKLQNLVEH